MSRNLRNLSLAGWIVVSIATGARGQKGNSPPSVGTATIGGPYTASISETGSPIFLYGKVVMEDGKPVGEPISVAYICGTRSPRVVQSDLKGRFQFILGTRSQGDNDMTASNDSPVSPDGRHMTVTPEVPAFGGAGDRAIGCELSVSIPGFRPLTKIVSDPSSVGSIDAGNLVIRRLEGVHGAAVSATSMEAPLGARKEFEKGENDARSHHLDSAMQHLEKAVAEYDKYAAAWHVLGNVYATVEQAGKARHAFQKAIAADSHYVPPYLSLAALDLKEGQYETAVEASEKAVALDPGAQVASYIEAAANYRLNRIDAAEKIGRNAEARPHQDVPQLHMLLAQIYMQRRDYPNALAEMRAYLKESPNGELATRAQQTIDQIEKSAPAAETKTASASPQVAP